MKLDAYQKSDICSITAILLAWWLMAPMPRLLAQAWWAPHLNAPAPSIGWDQQVIWGFGFFLVILIGLVLPERILDKAHQQRTLEY